MNKTRRILAMMFLGTVSVATFTKCTTKQGQIEPPRESSWKESLFVQDHITQNMLQAAPGGLCPHYSAVNKLKAWDLIVKAIVSAESSLNPNTSYVERTQGIDPVTGQQTVSEGYFQLSYKDTRHVYYSKLPAVQAISWPKKNIRDPHINLAAGLAIIDERIRRAGPDVVTALAPYWSVVRDYQVKLIPNLKKWIPECFQ